MKTETIVHSTDANLINSHIQMPKCILKRFEVNGNFYYYDVEKDIIGSRGHAKSHNTEKGYYSKEAERFLSDEIESTLGEFLKTIDAIDRHSMHFFRLK